MTGLERSVSSQRVNVLYLRDTDKVCGPGKTMINVHRTINNDRFSLFLCATSGSVDTKSAFVERAQDVGARVLRMKMGGLFDVATLLNLISLLKRLQIDILQTHDAQTRRIGVVAAKVAGIAHISSLHGWIQNTPKQRLSAWLDKRLIRFSNKVIVMSDAMKGEIAASGVSGSKIVVLPNAIVLSDYPTGQSGKRVREEFQIADDEKVVAIVGRLSPEKRHDDFLRMASRIVKNGYKVKFLIIGDGPLDGRLRATVATSGLDGVVLFTGHRTDMLEIYAAIDVLVIASSTEGSPNVLLEAFACGKPVVATNVGGIPDVLKGGDNGFLVETGDVAGLVRCVSRLVDDSALAKKLGANGRATIETRFNFRERTRYMEDLYSEVMSNVVEDKT